MSQTPSRAVLRTKPLSEKEVAAALKEIAGVPLSDHARTMLGVLLVSRSEELCDLAAIRSRLASIAAQVAQVLKRWRTGARDECVRDALECREQILDLMAPDLNDKEPLGRHMYLAQIIELETFNSAGLHFDEYKAAVSRMVGAIDVPNLDAESDPKLQELTHIRRVVLQEAFEKLTEFENELDSASPTKASRLLEEAVAALKMKPIKQA